jgi:TIR domain-containing protein
LPTNGINRHFILTGSVNSRIARESPSERQKRSQLGDRPRTSDYPDAMKVPSVFISYAHADRVQKDEILKHLRSLNHRFELIAWSDDEIAVGDDYREQIDAALTAASVSILLVSVDALDSSFIRLQELPRILDRRRMDGMLLIPVLVRPCAWRQIPWLEALQLENAKPLSELTEPEREQRCVQLAERVLAHFALRRDDRPTPSRPDEAATEATKASGARPPLVDPFHVDREEELQAFLSLFAPSTDEHVMIVGGPPAMGKTWFLRKCLAFRPAGSMLTMIDFKQLGAGVPEIIMRIATDFDHGGRFPNTFRRLEELIDRQPALQVPNVASGPTPNLIENILTKSLVDEARLSRMPNSSDLIVIDSLEVATPLVRAWVSTVLVGSVINDPGIVLVIAGQNSADVGRSVPAGVKYRELAPLALADAADLAAAYGLDLSPENLQAYHRFTNGNPLALAMGFDNLRAGRAGVGVGLGVQDLP